MICQQRLQLMPNLTLEIQEVKALMNEQGEQSCEVQEMSQ